MLNNTCPLPDSVAELDKFIDTYRLQFLGDPVRTLEALEAWVNKDERRYWTGHRNVNADAVRFEIYLWCIPMLQLAHGTGETFQEAVENALVQNAVNIISGVCA